MDRGPNEQSQTAQGEEERKKGDKIMHGVCTPFHVPNRQHLCVLKKEQ
jgi:hypothetical protein